jgi:hypothetical protein
MIAFAQSWVSFVPIVELQSWWHPASYLVTRISYEATPSLHPAAAMQRMTRRVSTVVENPGGTRRITTIRLEI